MVIIDCDQFGCCEPWAIGTPSENSDEIRVVLAPENAVAKMRGKIVIVGTEIGPTADEIELPCNGPWSRPIHFGLPRYSRRWFRDVFLILGRYAALPPDGAPANISVEVIEAILGMLPKAAF